MAKRVKRFRKDLENEHKRATRESMATLRAQIRANLLANESVARGVLLSDIRNDKKAVGPKEAAKRAISMPEWAKYTEEGSGEKGTGRFPAPSNPPYAAIREWAQFVPEIESPVAVAQAIAGQSDTSPSGTAPHPFYGPAWDGPFGYQQVIEENRRAMHRAVNRI